ncbi:MAG: sigma-70 family RNA polymerase sigma factor [Planctomycetota bacterium]
MSENESWTSFELFERFRSGDDLAAEEMFARYAERLTRLARIRLSSSLSRRVDPEDVVLSAWRSFFVGASNGRFSLSRSGDLWRLLVAIVMHKVYRQVRRHTSEKRDIRIERVSEPFAREDRVLEQVCPTPEEVTALAEEVEVVLSGLEARARRVFELRLQNESISNIADAVRCSERTARRTLEQIRTLLYARTWGSKGSAS